MALLTDQTILVTGASGGVGKGIALRMGEAGATVYLGVNVPGGLFSLGDGHYTMGEGETCGVAVEGAMNTVLTVELVKGVVSEWPRLENDEAIRILERQPFQKQVVDEAEDRRVHPDPKRERDHGKQGEGGRFEELAQSEA